MYAKWKVIKWSLNGFFMLRSFKPSLSFEGSRVTLVAAIPLEFYAAILIVAVAIQECFIEQFLFRNILRR